jgi:nitrite reductase/ring-hydroxylating ferredoxin subunit
VDGVRRVALCRAEELAEGTGRGFRLGEGTEQVAVFVIRWRGALYAYRNSCPHVGTPLDWLPDRFFDRAGAFLLCGTHGALFRPEDGLCVRGPCTGKHLAAAPIRVDDGVVRLELA